MDPEIKKRAIAEKYFEKDEYNLICEIGQGITLPQADKKYKVQLSVEDYTWNTEEPKETKGEYARWSCRSEVLSWKLPKNEQSIFAKPAEQLGTLRNEMRIYIYLLDEDDIRICFWKGVLSDFIEADAKWKWI